MKRMTRRGVPILFSVLSSLGCDGGDGGTTGPLFVVGPTARALLQELVQKVVYDAQWVFIQSHDNSRGFAYSLIGVDEGHVGAVTLVPNLAPGEYEPFCSVADDDTGDPPPPFWETRDRCTRVRVEAAGITFFDVYFTMQPHTLPDDEHTFRYEASAPAGEITYDPNPLVSWRADVRDETEIVVAANLDLHPIFEGEDGSILSLTHTGTIEVAGPASENPMHTIHLAFPELIGGESPLLIDLTIDPETPFTASGGVVVGDETLATIGGTGGALSFQWR